MVDFYANRVHVETSSSGTADLTLGAAISAAYQSFSGASVPNGATFPYTAYTSTQFECGHGAYSTTGPTLDRTAANVVAGTAGAGALTNFSANPRVFLGPLAEDWPAPGGGATPAGSSGQVQYNDAAALGAAPLWREGANALAQRNSTTAQAHHIYNTYTDASNYERLSVDWTTAANTLTISTQKGGTGNVRGIVIENSNSLETYGVLIRALGGANIAKVQGEGGIDLVTGNPGAIIARLGASNFQFGTNNLFWHASGPGYGGDVGLSRNAADVLEVNSGSAGTYRDLRVRHVRTEPSTVGALTAAGTAGAGARGFVTDSSITTFGTTVAAGGANAVPVYSDGTNWKVG